MTISQHQFKEEFDQQEGDPYIGTLVDGRYTVESILGEGGMGVVYSCKHKLLGKRVAMKILRANFARNQEVVTRFLNEARAASDIGNPHIVDISDFGRLPDKTTYFIMEYLNGMDLTHAMQTGPMPIDRIVHIASQIAEALASAHDVDIVHRDLKPDNIFLVSRDSTRDFVKILDFGIAKVSSASESRMTRAGTIFGTPHYMSPEQAAGSPVDHRSDIYSLGVILYELVSGQVPFTSDENCMAILSQHMYKMPLPIHELSLPTDRIISPELEAVIMTCLSKRPEDRYQSMRELADDLKQAQQGTVSIDIPVSMEVFQQDHPEKGTPKTPTFSPVVQSIALRSPWPKRVKIAGVLTAIGIAACILLKGSFTGTETKNDAKAATVAVIAQMKPDIQASEQHRQVDLPTVTVQLPKEIAKESVPAPAAQQKVSQPAPGSLHPLPKNTQQKWKPPPAKSQQVIRDITDPWKH